MSKSVRDFESMWNKLDSGEVTLVDFLNSFDINLDRMVEDMIENTDGGFEIKGNMWCKGDVEDGSLYYHIYIDTVGWKKVELSVDSAECDYNYEDMFAYEEYFHEPDNPPDHVIIYSVTTDPLIVKKDILSYILHLVSPEIREYVSNELGVIPVID